MPRTMLSVLHDVGRTPPGYFANEIDGLHRFHRSRTLASRKHTREMKTISADLEQLREISFSRKQESPAWHTARPPRRGALAPRLSRRNAAPARPRSQAHRVSVLHAISRSAKKIVADDFTRPRRAEARAAVCPKRSKRRTGRKSAGSSRASGRRGKFPGGGGGGVVARPERSPGTVLFERAAGVGAGPRSVQQIDLEEGFCAFSAKRQGAAS